MQDTVFLLFLQYRTEKKDIGPLQCASGAHCSRTVIFSEQHADPCHRRGDERKQDDPDDLSLAVEAEPAVSGAPFRFRIEVLEEMRFCKQEPVETDDVERFPEMILASKGAFNSTAQHIPTNMPIIEKLSD